MEKLTDRRILKSAVTEERYEGGGGADVVEGGSRGPDIVEGASRGPDVVEGGSRGADVVERGGGGRGGGLGLLCGYSEGSSSSEGDSD